MPNLGVTTPNYMWTILNLVPNLGGTLWNHMSNLPFEDKKWFSINFEIFVDTDIII